MRIVPIDTSFAATTQEVVLDNVLLKLAAHWNTRGGFWSIDIYDSSDAPIVLGLKMALGTGLLNRYASAKLPRGELVLVDTTGALDTVGYEDLGSIVHLVYMDEGELSAL